MGLKTIIAKKWAARRTQTIRKEGRDPKSSQERTLRQLLKTAATTHFGREHGFAEIRNAEQFRQQVPVRDYEAGSRFFDMIRNGQKDVCWPGQPIYLAKTSGTTSGSKYIPITRESIRNQVKAARDAFFFYMQRTGDASFLEGKFLFLSGSPVLETNPAGLKVGRLSGIVNHYVPAYLKGNQIPEFETNCIEDWETKIEHILDESIRKDLRLISGIPPWVQMFFERLHHRTGKQPLEAWPNLSVFVQGGVDFSPYKDIFSNYFENKVHVLEVFPASEGFFAIQDGNPGEGLLVNLGYGIFYEFIPLPEYGKEDAKRLGIHEVQIGIQYAMVVTTNAGLWAYDLGDTVKFTSLDPPRLIVTGRVKQFISAFGEHVIEEEVNLAMASACKKTGSEVNEFTVAPFVSEIKGESCHEWWVEFSKAPNSLDEFAREIDLSLQKQNAYYQDLRSGGMLRQVQIKKMKLNAAREYMKSVGKLGGQNKFPRLKNSREIANHLEQWEITN